MTPFNEVKNLYDISILNIVNSKSPFIHYNSENADEVHKSSFNQLVTSLLNEDKNGTICTICDIGCATGDILRSLDSSLVPNINYCGLDLNEKFILMAKSDFEPFPNINFYQYNIYNMNLSQNYDLITIYDTFAYFNTDEIIKMIDYYYSKTNKILSFILLDKFENYDKSLLIQSSDTNSILQYCSSSFKDSFSSHFFNLDKSNIFYIVNIFKNHTNRDD